MEMEIDMVKPLFGKQVYYWLCSYIIIMLVSVICSIFFFGVSISVIDTQLDNINTNAVTHTQEIFDEYFSDLDRVAGKTLNSAAVMNLLYSSQPTVDNKNEWSKAIIRDLAMNGENGIIKNSFIIYRNKDMCFDMYGMYPQKLLYEVFFNDCYGSEEEWKQNIFDISDGEYKIREADGKKRIFMIRYYVGFGLKVPVIFAAELNCDVINERLAGGSVGDNESFCVADKNGNILFGNADENTVKKIISSDESIVNTGENVIYKKESVFQSDWNYIYSVSNEHYLRDIRRVRLIYIGIYLAFMIVCGILAYWFSKRNYIPLQMLVGQLGKRLAKKDYENEFEYIGRFTMTILEEKRAANVIMDKQHKKINEGHLANLLVGEYNDKIKFKYEYFTVVIFDIRDFGVLSRSENENENELPEFVIENIAAELFLDYAEISLCEVGGYYTGVFNYQKDKCNSEIIADKLSYMSKYLEKNMEMKVVCAISRQDFNKNGLYHLYEQAYDTLLNVPKLIEREMVFLYDGANERLDVYDYDIKTESAFLKAMISGDEDAAVKIVNSIFFGNKYNNHLSLRVSGILFNTVISTALRAVVEKNAAKEVDTTALCALPTRLSRNSDMKQIVEELCDFVRKICRISDSPKEEYVDERIESIKKYISEQYADCDLSVNKIAENFGITPNYLSSYFKSCVGERMTDYIMKIRVERSKKLLSDTDESVKNIAKSVGIMDVNTFIRVFKRVEGITPGQYRTDFAE